MRRLNVVWVVIAPGRSHTLGLDVVGNNVLAVGKRQVTDSAVSLLREDFLGEQFLQFCRGAKFPIASGMIRVVDALDAHCQSSGLGRFLATAAEAGVVDGTVLVSVKLHGSAFVCFRGCCAMLCRWGVLLCFGRGIEMRSRPNKYDVNERLASLFLANGTQRATSRREATGRELRCST